MSINEREENQPLYDTDLLLPNGKPKAPSLGTSFTKSDCIILGIWTVVPATLVGIVWLALHVLSDAVQEYWLTHLALNLLGYLTVFLPGYATIRSAPPPSQTCPKALQLSHVYQPTPVTNSKKTCH